jgi:hypothetical protein
MLSDTDSPKTQAYKEFNRTVKTFLREMIQVFPEVRELRMALMLYKLMKTISVKRPQKIFNELIAANHSKDIIDGNFDVFLTDNFTYPEAHDVCEGLKKAFKEVDDSNRKVIHDYLLALLACNKKCLQLKQA